MMMMMMMTSYQTTSVFTVAQVLKHLLVLNLMFVADVVLSYYHLVLSVI